MKSVIAWKFKRHRPTGVCADRELREYLVDHGLATLDSSACKAKKPCYDDDTVLDRFEGATNDYYPGQTSNDYSYSYTRPIGTPSVKGARTWP